MISLENDSRKRRFGIRTRGECSSQSCTVSHRTFGVIKSPTTRNRTSVIYAKRYGYRKEGSPQRRTYQSKLWATCSTPAKLSQKSTRWRTTDVGALYTQNSRDWCPRSGALSVSMMRNDFAQFGPNWPKSSRRSSIFVQNNRYGSQQEIWRCNVH